MDWSASSNCHYRGIISFSLSYWPPAQAKWRWAGVIARAYLIIWRPDHITMAIALALLPKREKDILFLSIRNITQQSTWRGFSSYQSEASLGSNLKVWMSVSEWANPTLCWNLTDVTLAGEDTNWYQLIMLTGQSRAIWLCIDTTR